MNNTVSLLITSPHPGLVSDIASKRPGWRILSLGDVPPSSRLEGKVWGFIDWLGQSMSGLEMCRRLRESEATRGAHLTMVLEEPSSEAKRRALLAGADDYMVGPLDVTRLLERIESLGGARPSGRQLLVNGPVSLDPAAHQVRVNGRVVTIRPNEFRLLAHFIDRTATLNGKAMAVCMTRANAVRLYEELRKLPGCPEIKVVMTGDLGKDPKAWSEAGHLTTKPQRDAIKKRETERSVRRGEE